jgi:predicted transcriptional regulator
MPETAYLEESACFPIHRCSFTIQIVSSSIFRMYLLFLILAVAMVSCNREEISGSTTPPAAMELTATDSPSQTTSSTPMPTPEPSLTPSVTPSLTQLSEQDFDQAVESFIEVEDQVLTETGEVDILEVTAPAPGWIVIYSNEEGRPDKVLGFTSVNEGQSGSVAVTIEPNNATPVMHAILHSDYGITGDFEYPGPDRPFDDGNQLVQATFSVEIEAEMPELIVSDQVMVEEGIVVIDEVIASEAGYLALYSDSDGEPGRMLAYAPVKKGSTSRLALEVNWRDATPVLHALLYSDVDENNVFSPGTEDLPVVVTGEPVAASFRVQYPPDVFVLDQPVTNGTIAVERAVSYGPGWLVVYTDDDGLMGTIIGWAPLQDGINEMIDVDVVESAVTAQLHLLLHQDLDEVGQFEFPRTDPPVRFNERFPQPLPFQTDSGNYLITEDQELGSEGSVIVPLVVVDVDAWVVARMDDEGEIGEVIGNVSVPAGVNRDVLLPIDPELLTSTLHLFLHLDAGVIGEFEFPDGLDIPLQRNRAAINAPMTVISIEDR